MYKALERFMDGADPEHHVYAAGEVYPRDGYKPTEKRIAELSGTDNAFGRPIISGGTKAKRQTRARKVTE
ncbi:MAG: hypothetical protein ACOYBC_05525 [Bilifractor sp.]|jgi:hypothetical protein